MTPEVNYVVAESICGQKNRYEGSIIDYVATIMDMWPAEWLCNHQNDYAARRIVFTICPFFLFHFAMIIRSMEQFSSRELTTELLSSSQITHQHFSPFFNQKRLCRDSFFIIFNHISLPWHHKTLNYLLELYGALRPPPLQTIHTRSGLKSALNT